MGDTVTQTSMHVQSDGEAQVFVVETKRIRGTFAELLELKYFPFDVQVNRIRLLYKQLAITRRILAYLRSNGFA